MREKGIKQVGSYATSKKLNVILKKKNLTREAFAMKCGLSSTTISAACRGNQISITSSEKIAAALHIPVKQLFDIHSEGFGLSSKTILHHHRLISSILAQATRDRLVHYNIAI